MNDYEELQSFRTQLLLPEQRQLFDYWYEQAAGRLMPERRQISPAHFARLLPGISLVDVMPAVGDSRIRLAGTRLRDVYEREITGMSISELFAGERQEYWLTAFSHTIGKVRPTQGVVRGPSRTKDHLVQYWLKLPLQTSGPGVGMVLCCDVFMPAASEVPSRHRMLA